MSSQEELPVRPPATRLLSETTFQMATFIQIPMKGESTDGPVSSVPENTRILKMKALEDLFKGTEREVLYRVNMLIQQHTNFNEIERGMGGNSVLHIAVIKRFLTVAEKLIDHGADLLATNNEGHIPLYFALARRKWDTMAALLLSKTEPYIVRYLFGDKRSAPQHTENDVKCHEGSNGDQGRNRLENVKDTFSFTKIAKDFSRFKETVWIILDKLQENVDGKNVACVKILEEDGNGKEPNNKGYDVRCQSAFHFIAEELITGFANHPVSRALILHKWNNWAFKRFLRNTILYLLSFIALSFSAVTGAHTDDIMKYDSGLDYARAVFEVLSYIFALKNVVVEISQMVRFKLYYWQQFFNWMDIGAALFIILVLPLRFADYKAHWLIFALGYLMWAMKGLKFAAVNSYTAAYAETLRGILARDFVMFALFFCAVELAFGGTILLVLKAENSLSINKDTSTLWDIWFVGLRTMIEAQPVVGYTEADGYGPFATIALLVFLTVIIVILLNILIAQLVTTYQNASTTAQLKFWVNRAWIIAQFEKNEWNSCYIKSKWRHHYEPVIPIDVDENPIEELEDTRTSILQLEKRLVHTDLTIQTIQTKQSGLIDHVREIKTKQNAIFDQVSEMKSKQSRLCDQLEEIKALLQRPNSREVIVKSAND